MLLDVFFCHSSISGVIQATSYKPFRVGSIATISPSIFKLYCSVANQRRTHKNMPLKQFRDNELDLQLINRSLWLAFLQLWQRRSVAYVRHRINDLFLKLQMFLGTGTRKARWQLRRSGTQRTTHHNTLLLLHNALRMTDIPIYCTA